MSSNDHVTPEEDVDSQVVHAFKGVGESVDPRGVTFDALHPGVEYNTLPTYPARPSYREFEHSLRKASQVVAFDGCPHDPHHPASVPIYQTATFVQPSSTEFGAYDYTRSGNPTRTALETQLAMLEMAHAAFAFTSGMAALNTVMRLASSGEQVLIGDDIYGGVYRLVTKVSSTCGIIPSFVDTTDISKVRAALNPAVKLLHIETPSNPLMRISDIRAIAKVVHEHGVLLSVDSTMMNPYLQNPLELGADIVVHSGTKFLSGHSDTMCGVVIVAREDLAKRIAFLQNAEGTALAPFDCWLLLRGIKTLAIRTERAQENALKIAQFLSEQPQVTRVFYAGLAPRSADDYEASKAYSLHMSQARGGSSVISFTTGDVKLSRDVVDGCRLFKITVSFGSCNSLIEMPCVLSHASIPAEMRTLPDDLIRLSIGIEDVRDLLQDLKSAFAVATQRRDSAV
eukprot:GILK01003735.1.p1 GENE.GILK01003735.1~~GILK01003735.1.p1  ORF type:complete len:455 (-),score=51.20 GILK01003735.1:64-1428(-)